MTPSNQILVGDCIDMMRTLPDQSVQCCVTSPPYFGLRDYGVDGPIGLEQTPADFIGRLVEVFRDAIELPSRQIAPRCRKGQGQGQVDHRPAARPE
jgi:DNA modification methylase